MNDNKLKEPDDANPNPILKLDSNLAWFLGMFGQCGYVYPNAYVCLLFSLDKFNLAEQAKKELQRFGESLRISVEKGRNQNCYLVQCLSRDVVKYFAKYIKHPSCEPKVPNFIFNAGMDIRLAYITGALDAHGKWDDQVVSSISIRWLQDLERLCKTCGIETILHRNDITHDLYIITSHPGIVSKSNVNNNIEMPL
jgi:hypothetical protein